MSRPSPFDIACGVLKAQISPWLYSAEFISEMRHAIAVLKAAGKADPLNIIDKKLHDAVKKARDARKGA